jgi:hypothetical protein
MGAVKPGTIFISHRSEYADIVRRLKKVIEVASRAKIQVFISEEIPHADDWRSRLEKSLQESEELFLIYGAPYEDWSWCFYEAGYFSAHPGSGGQERKVYCIKRKDIPVPSPLSHLQAVEDEESLIEALIDIFNRNNVDFDAARLRELVQGVGRRLFGRIAELRGYPRISVTISNDELDNSAGVPDCALVEGDTQTITNLFGFADSRVTWGQLVGSLSTLEDAEKLFFEKWLNETAKVIRAGRENRVVAPQTVLIARSGGKRYRLLLYHMLRQAYNVSIYEFLAVDEIGGPAMGLPSSLLSLLTSIRMGFRFRYEIIEKFASLDWEFLGASERRDKICEFVTVLNALLAEGDARGDANINAENFYSNFDFSERTRMRHLINSWEQPIFGELQELLAILGGSKLPKEELSAAVGRFRNILEALTLLNAEFLGRSCGVVAKQMSRSESEWREGAARLDALIGAMRRASPQAAE